MILFIPVIWKLLPLCAMLYCFLLPVAQSPSHCDITWKNTLNAWVASPHVSTSRETTELCVRDECGMIVSQPAVSVTHGWSNTIVQH